MRAPDFWFNDPARPGALAHALTPLAALVARLTARRVAQISQPGPRVPVICVGNLNIGGTGKTPLVIALVERLTSRGQTPHVVTRGHGGTLAGPVRVDPARHSASDVGDEALLHAAFATTWVARDRAAGVRAAADSGASAILLDDGHQNPSVKKALSLVVVDACRGFGNGRVFPAGPLREPVQTGLKRAAMLLSVGGPEAQAQFADLWGNAIHCTHLTGRLEPLATGMDWEGLRVLAFAGIGDPDRFFATLDGLGAIRADSVALDDHQAISDSLFARLQSQAGALGAQLVCTEKDAVRLRPADRSQVLAVPVRLLLDDWGPLDARLAELGL